MKKLLTLLVLLSVASSSAADIIFQDINFKQRLLQSTTANSIAKDSSGNSIAIDTNANGEISDTEALAVYQLDVSSSSITNLAGIEFFLNVTNLNCKTNQLTTLDVSALFDLLTLDCSDNNLTSLLAKNGSNETIILSGNPLLNYICADASQFAAIEATVTASCEVNSYCTLPPGGEYNTISGQIIFNTLSNPIYPFIKVKCMIGSVAYQTMTDATGHYTFYTQVTSGSYTVTPSLDNATLFNTPAVASGTLNGTNKVHDFTLTGALLAVLSADLEVAIAPINSAMPGENAVYKIAFKNKAPNTTNTKITLNFDDAHTDYVSCSAPGASVNGGELIVYSASLKPFETRSFDVVLNVNPTYPVGSLLNFNLNIAVNNILLPGLLDALLGDNSFPYSQTVESVPANRTECLQGNTLANTAIGEYLHYMINFENLTNEVVQDITIRNVYDTSKYDISTLQVLYASHPVDVRTENNKAEYSFRSINAGGPGGHGGILLKIKTNNDMPANTEVENNAEIYFDYAQPMAIESNSVFGTLGMTENNRDASIMIYPNPTNSVVNINADSTISKVELYDASGRLIQLNFNNDQKAIIDLSERTNGIYFLKIISDKGIKVEKLVKS